MIFLFIEITRDEKWFCFLKLILALTVYYKGLWYRNVLRLEREQKDMRLWMRCILYCWNDTRIKYGKGVNSEWIYIFFWLFFLSFFYLIFCSFGSSYDCKNTMPARQRVLSIFYDFNFIVSAELMMWIEAVMPWNVFKVWH